MSKELPVLNKPKFDCAQCPGYCCSYELIIVTKHDIQRLARGAKIKYKQARDRFTKEVKGYGRVLRHREDPIYESACKFLHPETRRCAVYEHRPAVCREYPVKNKCGYFDFLKWERNQQQDDAFIPYGRTR
jgi:Fe-S-cluster containining protein